MLFGGWSPPLLFLVMATGVWQKVARAGPGQHCRQGRPWSHRASPSRRSAERLHVRLGSLPGSQLPQKDPGELWEPVSRSLPENRTALFQRNSRPKAETKNMREAWLQVACKQAAGWEVYFFWLFAFVVCDRVNPVSCRRNTNLCKHTHKQIGRKTVQIGRHDVYFHYTFYYCLTEGTLTHPTTHFTCFYSTGLPCQVLTHSAELA